MPCPRYATGMARTIPARTMLAALAPMRFEKFPREHDENAKIAQESHDARLRKVIEEDAMCAVEPGFAVLPRHKEIRIEMRVIHRREVLRTPAEDRAFQKSLPRLTPYPQPGLRRSIRQAELQQASLRQILGQTRYSAPRNQRRQEQGKWQVRCPTISVHAAFP